MKLKAVKCWVWHKFGFFLYPAAVCLYLSHPQAPVLSLYRSCSHFFYSFYSKNSLSLSFYLPNVFIFYIFTTHTDSWTSVIIQVKTAATTSHEFISKFKIFFFFIWRLLYQTSLINTPDVPLRGGTSAKTEA